MSTWAIDFASLDPSRNKGTVAGIADPPGYAVVSSKKAAQKVVTGPSPQEQELLKVKKAWDVALAPAKSIPMNAFMLWMSGNGVQIFSVMITGMLFMNPIKALAVLNQTFERYQTPENSKQLMIPKIAFVGMQIVTMCLGIWKLSAMGLLPTTTSDWLAFMDPKEVMERAILG